MCKKALANSPTMAKSEQHVHPKDFKDKECLADNNNPIILSCGGKNDAREITKTN